MPTPFLTGMSQEVKPYVSGVVQGENVTRYALVNSRNRNRKIIRMGTTLSTQFLGIFPPTAAPTAAGGVGATLIYAYVYVNKRFIDLNANVGFEQFIRSNASPTLTTASQTAAPTITGTASTDPQVTHVWLYVADPLGSPVFFRLETGYEVSNGGVISWTGTTTVPGVGESPELETDNEPPSTCRIVEEADGFFNFAGFVPIDSVASVTVGFPTVTITSGIFPDGILGLSLQFLGDTTGGPTDNGIHTAEYTTSTTLTLVNDDGTPRNYDGPFSQVDQPVRIWRNAAFIEISKQHNPDFTPQFSDENYLIRANGPVTGIAKPGIGFALRYHSNKSGKKSVEIADFSQGIPPKRSPTTSVYSMSNPRAWVSAGARLFYYDVDAGVIEDRGAIHVPITLPIIPNLIKSLGKNSADISEMEYDETRNIIFLTVCPSGYTRSYYLINYNLTSDSWNLWFMLPDVLAMRKIKNVSTGEVVIKMGSSQGSYTIWPSSGFNEAVGTSTFGTLSLTDDATHLTDSTAAFPATGDKLKDRWVMVWDNTLDNPVYQFARISDNTATRLTLDTFIGDLSTTMLNPIPTLGSNYWVGPIQSILGPNFEFNSTPDDDGQILDVAVASSGLTTTQKSRLSLYRNFEATPAYGSELVHNEYTDSSKDPDHQSIKLGAVKSIESTGVTGWKITDNNESPLSIKALVKRVKAIHEELRKK